MAEDARDAVDGHRPDPLDVDDALDATFGSVTKAVVPSRDEWARG